jgi:hypothetical protein
MVRACLEYGGLHSSAPPGTAGSGGTALLLRLSRIFMWGLGIHLKLNNFGAVEKVRARKSFKLYT